MPPEANVEPFRWYARVPDHQAGVKPQPLISRLKSSMQRAASKHSAIISARVPEETKQSLVKLATQRGLKLGAYITHVLCDHVKKEVRS